MNTTPERVYISGPMSGIADHNFPAFNAAAALVKPACAAPPGIRIPATTERPAIVIHVHVHLEFNDPMKRRAFALAV